MYDLIKTTLIGPLFLTALQTANADQCAPNAVDIYKPAQGFVSPTSFDWSMPDRYAVPANAKFPLLPNTLDYVMNWEESDGSTDQACPCRTTKQQCLREGPRYKVTLKASAADVSAWTLKTQDEIEREFANAGCQNVENLAVSALAGARRVPNVKTEWAIRQQTRIEEGVNSTPDGSSVVWDKGVERVSGNEISLCLPSGKHRVSVAQTPREKDGKRNAEAKVTTRTIDVVDHFIVVMGDSFAAGEGAPERAYTGRNQTSWARAVGNNNGNLIALANRAKRIYADNRTANLRAGECDRGLLGLSSYDRRVLNHFDNLRSHRSSYTHGSQLALDLESRSDKSSVTFVNLAQTGATIKKGVMGNYAGSNEAGNEAVIPGSYGANGTMCPQTEMLKEISGGRAPDDILLSVGGNDAGFALAISSLYVAWDGDTRNYSTTGTPPCRGAVSTACNMIKAVGDGAWNWVKNGIESSAIGNGAGLEGLDGLANNYQDLHREFGYTLYSAYDPSRVTLIAPPFFGTKTPIEDSSETDLVLSGGGGSYEAVNAGRVYDENGTAVQAKYCYLETTQNGPVSKISLYIVPKEFRVADYEVYRPLVEEMRAATRAHKWTYLSQNVYDAARLGICQPSPYGKYGNPQFSPGHPVPEAKGTVRGFRTTGDSMQYQHGVPYEVATTKGQFHPNEFGYALTKRLLTGKATTPRMELYSNARGDANDTIAEANQLPALGVNKVHRISAPDSKNVNIYRITVPALNEVNIQLTNNRQGGRSASEIYKNCGAVTVFDEAGRMVATSSPLLSKDNEVASESLDEGSRAQSQFFDFRCIGYDSDPKRAPGIVQINGFDHASNTLTSRTGFVNGCREQVYYVAVSGSENIFFDPIIGSTDENASDSAIVEQAGLVISSQPIKAAKGSPKSVSCPSMTSLDYFLNREDQRVIVNRLPQGIERQSRISDFIIKQEDKDDDEDR